MEHRPDTYKPDFDVVRIQRLLFELTIRHQQAETRDAAQRAEEARKAELEAEQEQLFNQLLENLPSQYDWMKTASEEQSETLLSAFKEVHDFATQANDLKPGREVYIHFRRRIETEQPSSDHDINAVHLVEALLEGDLTKGVLPF